jgi:signal peptide peptidase SppA
MLSRKSRKKKGKNPEPGWLTRLARGKRKFVAHVRLKGAIGMDRPLSPSLSMAGIEDTLETAFAIPGLAAVAISVNSPGGSPVQSTLIHSRIRQLAEETGVKVMVFCEDVAASGGYLLALAGDEIFADRSSIVGSIGVISASFGFTDAMKKVGVERRVYTAGTNKSVLDPFLPEKKEDVEHLKSLQLDVHEAFKDIVRGSRGDKLKGDEKELFSGLFWSGGKALEFGLVDGIGSLHTTLRERFGDDVIIRTVDARSGLSLRKLLMPGGGKALQGGVDHAAGTAAGAALERAMTLAEERALWSRYGL